MTKTKTRKEGTMLEWVREQITYADGNKRLWTDAELLYLLANRNEKTIEEMAEDLGRTPAAVKGKIYAGQHKTHRLTRHRADILRMIDEGRSTLYMGEVLGFHHQSVDKFLRTEGLWRRYKARLKQ